MIVDDLAPKQEATSKDDIIGNFALLYYARAYARPTQILRPFKE